MTKNILRIDASARTTGSVSRELTDSIVARLAGNGAAIVTRDLANGLPHIDGAWVSAARTPADQRDSDMAATLALSDELVAEVQDADTIVIGTPFYNFNLPSTLKNWIDLIARAGVTFRYTEKGPEGLLSGKRVIVAVASDGVAIGSDYDFATGYLRFVLGFLGITDVEFVGATGLAMNADAARSTAATQISALAA